MHPQKYEIVVSIPCAARLFHTRDYWLQQLIHQMNYVAKLVNIRVKGDQIHTATHKNEGRIQYSGVGMQNL